MVAPGIMNAFRPQFIVPGTKKFGPDLVARGIGGTYNKSDVFNQSMLLHCMIDSSAAQIYDATTLFH